MKFALIGQDIPVLLPALLADLLFAGREPGAALAIGEQNPAMQDLLREYAQAVFRHAGLGGSVLASGDPETVLSGADCVLYAGDPQAASRFFMDRNALGNDREGDPGLTDQARVNGGIGGLLHALRAGKAVLRLCDAMDRFCPDALVVNLGQPLARTTAVFLNRGYRCLGMGRTPWKGANGVDTYAKRLQIPPEKLTAETAGLPGFAFLTEIRDGKADLLPKLKKAAENGELGSLSRRWLRYWDAVPAGDVTDLAEFLPAQPDYIPEEKPEFGESVEKRKERILYMNTVRAQGAEATEGAMAQLLLLSKAPPIRPMKLALALLRKETAEIPAVARRNGKNLPQLPEEAIIETTLRLSRGQEKAAGIRLPEALADVMAEIDAANRLAAEAAAGDAGALRECVETDPALAGLDRLYCQDVVRALMELHADMLDDGTDEGNKRGESICF